jgi:hypothetical protein
VKRIVECGLLREFGVLSFGIYINMSWLAST